MLNRYNWKQCKKREITTKGKIIQEIRLNDQSRVYCVLSNKLRLLCVNIFKAVLLKSGRPHPKPSQLLLCSELVIKQNICFSCTWISHHLSCFFSSSLSIYGGCLCMSFRIRWLVNAMHAKYICNENIYLSSMWMEFCFFTHFNFFHSNPLEY